MLVPLLPSELAQRDVLGMSIEAGEVNQGYNDAGSKVYHCKFHTRLGQPFSDIHTRVTFPEESLRLQVHLKSEIFPFGRPNAFSFSKRKLETLH